VKSHTIEQLYNEFHEKLTSFIRNRVADEDEAKDLLHDVFLKIHSHIDSLNTESKVESWLYQIARNSIIDYYRKKSRNDWRKHSIYKKRWEKKRRKKKFPQA